MADIVLSCPGNSITPTSLCRFGNDTVVYFERHVALSFERRDSLLIYERGSGSHTEQAHTILAEGSFATLGSVNTPTCMTENVKIRPERNTNHTHFPCTHVLKVHAYFTSYSFSETQVRRGHLQRVRGAFRMLVIDFTNLEGILSINGRSFHRGGELPHMIYCLHDTRVRPTCTTAMAGTGSMLGGGHEPPYDAARCGGCHGCSWRRAGADD